MKQLTCPIDGKPCERDCPDRYADSSEVGCILTTAQKMGANLLIVRDAKGEHHV